MHDVLCSRIARPCAVLRSWFEGSAFAGYAGNNERIAPINFIQHRLPHACHDAHVHHDIWGIRKLDPDMRNWGTYRPHPERNHIHRSSPHASSEELFERFVHLTRLHPIVGRPCVIFALPAKKRAVLYASHIFWIRALGSERKR